MQSDGQRAASIDGAHNEAKTHRSRAAAAFVLASTLWISTASAATPTWAVAVLPSGHEFSLEVAADGAARERGYMFRDRVGEREGMIFVFESTERHSFWMKNCRIALDILWLDAAFRVVDIAHDRAPCPAQGDCPSVQPAEPARYVVEFAAGTARREGLHHGDPVVVLSEPPLR